MTGRTRRFFAFRLPRAGDAPGFTLLELVMALTVLSMVAVGFAMSLGFGFKTIALARQRQTASEIGSARLEHLRSIPYGEVALSSQPLNSTDPDNPDHLVSGSTYDMTGEGQFEELIVDTTSGGVLHLEDPVQVGKTVMEIYQYVTWVDDANVPGTQDYRRVTVVVKYKAPAVTGISRTVRASSLFTPGTVTLIPTSTTTTVPAATTTTEPPATTTTTGTCPGDVTGPTGSFTLGGSAGAEVGYTAAANVTLTMALDDPCPSVVARFANDGGALGSDVVYDPLNAAISWSLGTGDGLKQVSGVARDGVGNEAALATQSIVLDSVAPTTPATLNRTASCAGSNRTVTLSWGISTDVNFRGYRVYRSTDGVSWSALTTVTATTASDTHSKTLDSVRYYVVGYDKAGNESSATNVVSLSKNQCS